MPEKVIHEIRLNQYSAVPADRTRRFPLGTKDSYGIEQLRIVPGEGWDGLTITATFHPPEGEAVQVLVPADGLIDVPPEATRSGSELPLKYGKIVFAGVADGMQRISCNLPYTVMEHAPVDGAASSGPSPSWYEQAAAHFLPDGGKAGQVLAKASDADLDVEWRNRSTPDWTQNDPTAADYIKNRPFYAGDLVETELADVSAAIEATQDGWNIQPIDDSLSICNGSADIQGLQISVGDTIDFMIDGVSHIYTAVDMSQQLGVDGYLGFGQVDLLLLSNPDFNSLVFAAGGIYSVEYNSTEIGFFFPASEAPKEFKMIGKKQEIVKIDKKFLPPMAPEADPELSEESTNPIENQAVAKAINALTAKDTILGSDVSSLQSNISKLQGLVGSKSVSSQISDAVGKVTAESLGIYVSDTEPSGAAEGDIWIDTSENAMTGAFDSAGYLKYKVVSSAPTTYEEGVLYIVSE